MNKQKIKAELRRSACEDEMPNLGLEKFALAEVLYWSDWPRVGFHNIGTDDLRTFMLLIADAL